MTLWSDLWTGAKQCAVVVLPPFSTMYRGWTKMLSHFVKLSTASLILNTGNIGWINSSNFMFVSTCMFCFTFVRGLILYLYLTQERVYIWENFWNAHSIRTEPDHHEVTLCDLQDIKTQLLTWPLTSMEDNEIIDHSNSVTKLAPCICKTAWEKVCTLPS